jgi:hypothetical protein
MALDLFSPLRVTSWASAHAGCPMRYKVNSADEMVVIFGSGSDEFEFSFEVGALRKLVQLGSEALDKMDASADESPVELVTVGEPLDMSSHLVPGDHAFYDDKQLIADLSALNGRLSRYVLRHLDADAKRNAPPSPDDERVLAETMATLAGKVQKRADGRTRSDRPAELEGDAKLRRLGNGRPSER